MWNFILIFGLIALLHFVLGAYPPPCPSSHSVAFVALHVVRCDGRQHAGGGAPNASESRLLAPLYRLSDGTALTATSRFRKSFANA